MDKELQAVYDQVLALQKQTGRGDVCQAVRKTTLEEVLQIIIAVGIQDPEY